MPAKAEAFFEKVGKKQAGLVLLQRKIKKKKKISGCCYLIERKVKLSTQPCVFLLRIFLGEKEWYMIRAGERGSKVALMLVL